MVYTDGSVCGGAAGSRACSAILYLASATVKLTKLPVGRMVSIAECEIEGIISGIYTAIDYRYFKNSSPGACDATVYILCDSLTAIEAIDKMDVCIPPHADKRLNAFCKELATTGINITLLNIP